MKAWKWALMAAIATLLSMAACAWEASAGDLVEDPNGRGTVWSIKAGETVYLARNRQVTLMLTMDASQATAQAQKSGRMYQVTQTNNPTFNTGNQRERLTCLSVMPQGFLRVKSERTN